ncbi:MAG: efflux transporter outer membrane subunit [Ketobacter sp.]|nr:MAG: efflux transporter outer membrane subunit [Ketobacter sp.]
MTEILQHNVFRNSQIIFVKSMNRMASPHLNLIPKPIRDGKLASLCMLAVLISACTLSPEVERPAVPVVSNWDYADDSTQHTPPPPADWWRGFGSQPLDQLVRRALQQNLEIAAAQARLRQAQSQITIASASLWPSLSLSGLAEHSGSSQNSDRDHAYSAAGAASYELDLWGSNRATRNAAIAQRDAVQFDQATVRTTTVASVVNRYLEWLALEERIRVANNNLTNAQQVLDVVEARYRYGADTALSLAQQRAQVASQTAAIPSLQQQARQARAALAVLSGRPAQGFTLESTRLDHLRLPEATQDLPAAVLARRPDVQQAEAILQAAGANIVVARAALYPSLRLNGSLQWQNAHSGDLFSSDPLWSLAGSVTQSLFQGGSLRAQVETSRSVYEELAADYVRTVLSALADADLALANVRSLQRQLEAQIEQENQARIANELAQTRYRAGGVDLLTVLETQRSLFSAQDSRLQLQLARFQGMVTLYRELGAVPPPDL